MTTWVACKAASAYYYWIIKVNGPPLPLKVSLRPRSMLERYDSTACR